MLWLAPQSACQASPSSFLNYKRKDAESPKIRKGCFLRTSADFALNFAAVLLFAMKKGSSYIFMEQEGNLNQPLTLLPSHKATADKRGRQR
jgi:hypothetical protein